MNIYLDLVITFAKVGVLTFGGGAAMLPMLEREIVDKKGWANEDELIDYYAIGQCTPGIIAVNTATFIGKKQGGVLGGILATFGMVLPSLVIITILSTVISNFSHLDWINHAFAGIRVAVCILIINSVIKLSIKAIIDIPTTVIFVVVFLGAVFLDINPVIFVILAAVAGIIMQVKKP